ncbi:dihydrofolate synthase/folylpolyglutamate synthase [Lebetimonas natsushimae]|uniref:Dihydrofolate synthase/folylpolyglutamate synthase n=1 Tax=Lebetimonas natsushimae TaxID=1936991 RepID=A0A292YAF3_9BACT|nr:bifunctional folylpolyglutamate synthase/dihydrofolate synthase [Lebetimonas natsushimae]GAX87037.1 dihydrofolate synthase/folylpolyglutamate synthase [Lebetimonas natsushimae]
MENVKEFLEKKPLFYKEIDITRMPKAYNLIKDKINLKPLIHIIGTNGKGSTGRFLAHTLLKRDYSVGHYTSPHILKFNERIWINGKNISDEALEEAHSHLQKLLPKKISEALSYFEYTTLLAAIAFENLDFVILEAGLGGEFDATNVFDKKITLITPIDFDHQNFLGNSIKEIATTKLHAIDKEAIIGKQVNKLKMKNKEWTILEYAKKLKPNAKIYDYLDFFEKNEINELKKEFKFADFLFDNYLLAMSFLKKEKIPFSIKDIEDLILPGRMQEIEKDLFIDVGHNPLAANAIVKTLNKKVNLVYNTYKDKNYTEILKILKPKIKKLYLINVKNERIEDKEKIKEVAKNLGIEVEDYKGIEKPMLVFGSFSVVEEFLRREFAGKSL